jgi:hypothetical protein
MASNNTAMNILLIIDLIHLAIKVSENVASAVQSIGHLIK